MNFPLHVLASVKKNGASGAGWLKLNSSYIDRVGALPDSTRNIIHGMRYIVTRELASYVDSSMGQIVDLNGATQQTMTTTANYPTLPARLYGWFSVLPKWVTPDFLTPSYACAQIWKEMYADAIDDSYTIYITNIPLTNYKNQRTSALPTQTKGGYSKNILANVPVPYQVEYVVENSLIGHYEPYVKPIVELKNQTLKTNYFTVEIRNAIDDTPARYLRSVTINFTIVDKKSKLIN